MKIFAMKKPLLLLLPLLFLSCFTQAQVEAQESYVIDKIPIPIRSSNCGDCKILQWGVTAGLEVEVLSTDGDWSQVTTPGGITGWIETQYLTTQRTLNSTEQEYLNQIDTLNAQYSLLVGHVNRLLQETSPGSAIQIEGNDPEALEAEMAQLIQSASDAITLGSKNADLLKRNQTLQNELDLTNAENERLRLDTGRKWFVYGAMAVAAGVMLGLIMPIFRRRKKGFSEWN